MGGREEGQKTIENAKYFYIKFTAMEDCENGLGNIGMNKKGKLAVEIFIFSNIVIWFNFLNNVLLMNAKRPTIKIGNI